ncbi:DNA repair protein RecN [Dysgonomonas macrotermitis]|uniref:DNA repair protein RecN n=1 Tax=Dysgonomonas macrotermitis TaxID=1346286 RepID=A0A1M4YIT0_9BACT|nr:DNA repair protein RecN [Dysgonomonas macrotermitis]SHF05735.1 DNA replication and repair protein RecN [Dysgonomonas macrotermitis]
MLKSLYIKNYALIDSLEMDFESGFSVITGETGAGKSIILGALSLILGQRADTKALKQGEAKCVIEGTFDVSAYDLKSFCEEAGIEYDPETYILRREILSSGKSRAFINDSPVSLNELKDLGGFLIDIHSQHQNLMLGDTHFQMQVVDSLAGTGLLLKDYKEAFKIYRLADKALTELKELAAQNKADEDYFRFQYEALSEAKLSEDEQQELEQEQELLNHAEDIKSALYKIHTLLSDDDKGIVTSLKDSIHTANNLNGVYPNAESIIQRLDSAYIDLKDLSGEIERSAGDVEFDPERLSFIEERLDQLYTLQQKHRVSSVAELLVIYNDLKTKLANIDSFDQQIEDQEKDLRIKQEKMLVLAEKLSKQRKTSAPKIEKQLIDKITYLGMPNVRFECRIEAKSHPDTSGIDDLQFMFSANKNMPLQPVADVASGGEISRVMLCLKSMIAGATALPTIIFDEIDTGVSGEVADKMGQIMKDFGQQMQVIAITHLPQIAAKGKAHYFVYKADDQKGTTTNLKRLTDGQRIQEIAQMLSGAKITDAAIENAKEMLELK